MNKKWQIVEDDCKDTVAQAQHFQCVICDEVHPLQNGHLVIIEGGFENISKKEDVIMQVGLLCDECYKKGNCKNH